MVQERLPARYRVLEEVGQGGMAIVYRAQDENLKREVAVKVLHPHLLAESDSKARLEREAQAVAKLQHDNIVQIFDYSGPESPSSFIVTEFIDGQTLKQFLGAQKLPAPEVAALVAIQVAEALRHAHGLGIIHRDVKPENVMVRKDGALKLMDFGVAQIMDLERMTVTGQLLGSPAYMAPELLEGKPLDVRTDVFSVGIMLYQLATGTLPFSGRNPHEVLKKIAEGRFTHPRTQNRLIADRLARIIAKALARKPEDRYPTIAAMLEDLRAFAADAGLEHPREEVARYFREPEAYSKELPVRMVAALVAAGKRERAARRTARALELWNRALAWDPSNAEVQRELRRLAGRQNLERVLIGVAGLAAAAAGAFFLFRKAESEGDRSPLASTTRKLPATAGSITGGTAQGTLAATDLRSGSARTSTPPLPAPIAERPNGARATAGKGKAQAPQEGRGRIQAASGGSATARAHGTAASAAAAGTPTTAATAPEKLPEATVLPTKPQPVPIRNLTIAPVPPAPVVMLLDGKPTGPRGGKFDTDNNQIPIPRDGKPHRITLRLPGLIQPEEIVVDETFVWPAGDRHSVRLKGLPATLTVTTVPAADVQFLLAEVDADEGRQAFRMAGQVGREIKVSFEGDLDLQKAFEVTVMAQGQEPVKKKVDLRAGQDLRITIPLPR
jgi:serine/threonine-protein kinase